MTSLAPAPSRVEQHQGTLSVTVFLHPQGCRSYVLADPTSGRALALDVHLDLVGDVEQHVNERGWTLPYVVDSHTHADHPSGAEALASRFASTRIAHPDAGHLGVTRHPLDGEMLHLGDVPVQVRHAPGHTPDHLVLIAEGGLFSGDSLFIGSVARTDFLGADARALFHTLHALLHDLPAATVVYPGHDYTGRLTSTLDEERKHNPWLQIDDPDEFARRLAANPPARPVNMDDLLTLNREGRRMRRSVDPAQVVTRVHAGGASSVIDVRSGVEWDVEHIPGSRHVPLGELERRLDEVRSAPAPRLLLCRTGQRAEAAWATLTEAGLGALQVVEGGIEAFRAAGGETAGATVRMTLERQVRVAVGALGLLGCVGVLLVHPAFVVVPTFLAAGSLFAGLTDWCGMGLLLARMPWNKRSHGPPAAGMAQGACAAAPGCAAGPTSR